MGIKGESGVQDNTKTACQGGGRDDWVVNGKWEGSNFLKSGFGANEEELCFVTVEFEEEVLRWPCFYCRDPVFDVVEGRILGGFGVNVDLGVISITVEVEVEFPDDAFKGEQVADEKKGAGDWSWGTPCITGERVDVWPERETNCCLSVR